MASGRIKPFYQAHLTLSVGDSRQALKVSKDDIDTSVTLASAYGSLIRSRPVLDSVARELDLSSPWQELKNRVHVDLSEIETPTISVSVRAGSSAGAEAIAAAIGERAMALSPASHSVPLNEGSRAFAVRQTVKLEDAIRRTQRRIARFRAAASAPVPKVRARVNDKVRVQFKLIEQWLGNYVFVKRLSAQVSPNSVRLLEPAEASTAPVRPDAKIDVVLGVAIGAVTGFGLAQIAVFHRRRGAWAAPAPGSGGDPWVEQLAGPP